ncbi:MAG: MBL fold metallo-hydrolase [Verrucomicrobiota bacterium]
MNQDHIDKKWIEDGFEDVLAKARTGLGFELLALSEASSLSIKEINRLLQGEFNADHLSKIAKPLGLNAKALLTLVEGKYSPQVQPPDSLVQMTSDYSGLMLVNAFLYIQDTSAWLFDTGADAEWVFDLIEDRNLDLKGILITHGHRDHIACLKPLVNRFRCPAYGHSRLATRGILPIEWGQQLDIAGLKLECRQTTGHAADGITYVISGTPCIAFVGDAIFAGSMGGPKISYEEALETAHQSILSLPEETILCPGHGCMTTVGYEKEHNPFFA